MQARDIVHEYGGSYAKALGIRLSGGKPSEIYKWFLAAVLFGARISETLAIRTYGEFERSKLLSPDKIVKAGWDRLVQVLDRGGYARYDFKTATKLLEINRALLHDYDGDLTEIYRQSRDTADLEQRLKELGKGIGDVTVGIFLRELRGVWRKARPAPSQLVIDAASDLGMLPKRIKDSDSLLEHLTEASRKQGIRPAEFSDFEAALVRYGKALRKSHAGRGRGQGRG